MSAVEFWTQLAKNDRGLPRKIVDFNFYPVRGAHPTHFNCHLVEHRELLPTLTTDEAICRRLFEGLPPRSGYNETCWDFTEPRRRLALLESSHLESILKYAGAAFLHDEISREIARPKLTDLISRHGQELYQFALKKAPVLLGSRKAFPVIAVSSSLADSVEYAGRTLFQYCFQGQPDSVLHRLELRFPMGWTWDWSGHQTNEVSDSAWKWLHRIAVREIAQETSPCFE